MYLGLLPNFAQEARLALLTPRFVGELRAYVQAAPDSGFLQHERYGFAGARAEWLPSHRVTVGAYATVIRAVTDRAPLVWRYHSSSSTRSNRMRIKLI